MTANKKGNNTRGNVITEAAKQFYLQGYKDTTMRSLASAVGIKHPSLFSIFENKSAIASVLLTRYFKGLQKSSAGFIAQEGICETDNAVLLAFYALNFNLIYLDRRFAEFFSSFYDEDSEAVDAIVINLGHLSGFGDENDDIFHQLDKKVLGLSAMMLVRELGARNIDPRIATQYFVAMIIEVNAKVLNLTSQDAKQFYEQYFERIEKYAAHIDIYKDYFLNEEL